MVNQFLQELAERVGEHTTKCNVGWSSEILVLLYYARNNFQDLGSKYLQPKCKKLKIWIAARKSPCVWADIPSHQVLLSMY